MAKETRLDERTFEILKLLWEKGPMKPAEVQKGLSFKVKNSALRWLLNELVESGHLERSREGKAFRYKAVIERRSVLADLGNRLSQIFFGGSPVAMIGELMELQKLSKDDVAYLSQIAKPKIAKSRKKQKRNKQ